MDRMNSEELFVLATRMLSPHSVLSVRMPVGPLLFLQIIHTTPVKRATSPEHLQISCSPEPGKF